MGRAGRPNPHPNLFNFSQDTIIWASPLWSLLDRARACIDEELCVRGRNLVQEEGIRGHRYKSGKAWKAMGTRKAWKAMVTRLEGSSSGPLYCFQKNKELSRIYKRDHGQLTPVLGAENRLCHLRNTRNTIFGRRY